MAFALQLGATYGSHHIGCTVADVHNVLRNGGIYLSPQTRSNPNGKVRQTDARKGEWRQASA